MDQSGVRGGRVRRRKAQETPESRWISIHTKSNRSQESNERHCFRSLSLALLINLFTSLAADKRVLSIVVKTRDTLSAFPFKRLTATSTN